MDQEKPIELVYWNLRGMAQPIRHLLEYLGLPYTQTKCQCPIKWFNEDLDQLKKKCLFPSLPYINDNDFVISETVAISKYLCKKANRNDLLGSNVDDQAKVDQLLAKFVLHRNKLSEIFKKEFLEGSDDRVKSEKLDQFYVDLMSNQYIPTVIKTLNTSDWLLGYLTIADFFAYQSIFYLTGIYSEKMLQYKQIYKFKANFESIPQIQAYNESTRVMHKTFMIPLKNIWKGDQKYT